jgi:hypothetical protein
MKQHSALEILASHVKSVFNLEKTEKDTFKVELFLSKDQILRIKSFCKNRAELDLFLDFAITTMLNEIDKQEGINSLLEVPDRHEFNSVRDAAYGIED